MKKHFGKYLGPTLIDEQEPLTAWRTWRLEAAAIYRSRAGIVPPVPRQNPKIVHHCSGCGAAGRIDRCPTCRSAMVGLARKYALTQRQVEAWIRSVARRRQR